MSRNAPDNESGKFGENSPNVLRKFKDVQRGPLISGDWDENGVLGKFRHMLNESSKDISKGAPWKVKIFTKMANMVKWAFDEKSPKV